jgi:hypothetical protein
MSRSLRPSTFFWCCLVSFVVAYGDSNRGGSAEAGEASQSLPAGTIVTFKTRSASHCIGVDGASTENDKSLGRFNCDDDKAPNQRWRVERMGDQYRFRNLKSRKCMGVDNARRDPGARVAQYFCRGGRSSNQTWRLIRDTPNVVKEFRNAKSDLCLGVSDSEQLLKQYECNTPRIIKEWRIVVR